MFFKTLCLAEGTDNNVLKCSYNCSPLLYLRLLKIFTEPQNGSGCKEPQWVIWSYLSAWVDLAGASLENKEINHLHNSTSELSDVKFLPFISIQIKNIFVLPCQLNGPSPGRGGAGMTGRLSTQVSSALGPIAPGMERRLVGVQS